MTIAKWQNILDYRECKRINAMQLTVDKFGRILLPKALRDDAGLHPGSLLEAFHQNGAIQLQLAEETPLVAKEGILLFTGESQGNLEDAVHRSREERNCRGAGWKA
ncbi:MAG TPA: hypothetical protein PK689_04985 [Kiritimatiellia bacterium]|nr:hypothetical protein [Kiritimatiellia bacterium]